MYFQTEELKKVISSIIDIIEMYMGSLKIILKIMEIEDRSLDESLTDIIVMSIRLKNLLSRRPVKNLYFTIIEDPKLLERSCPPHILDDVSKAHEKYLTQITDLYCLFISFVLELTIIQQNKSKNKLEIYVEDVLLHMIKKENQLEDFFEKFEKTLYKISRDLNKLK